MRTKRARTEHWAAGGEVNGFKASAWSTLRSDGIDRSAELPPESGTVTSANLKLVFDVEYRAPE